MAHMDVLGRVRAPGKAVFDNYNCFPFCNYGIKFPQPLYSNGLVF